MQKREINPSKFPEVYSQEYYDNFFWASQKENAAAIITKDLSTVSSITYLT